MELTSLFIGLLIGAVIGAIILYFILKSSSVPRSSFDDLNQKFIKTNSDLENSTRRITELQQDFTGEKEKNQVQQEVINELKNHLAKFSAEYTSLNSQFQEQREFNSKQSLQIETLNQDRQNVYEKNAELSAINESLKNSLENQKEEITKMQELAKNEFQNLANKILEEKSEKFTEQNQIQLKTILHPLQEKINDFEKKVENTHKESIDYHAALRQQIIGLQDLNKQMSKETLNLTKALKGDNKIQGNWGELVLERV